MCDAYGCLMDLNNALGFNSVELKIIFRDSCLDSNLLETPLLFIRSNRPFGFTCQIAVARYTNLALHCGTFGSRKLDFTDLYSFVFSKYSIKDIYSSVSK